MAEHTIVDTIRTLVMETSQKLAREDVPLSATPAIVLLHQIGMQDRARKEPGSFAEELSSALVCSYTLRKQSDAHAFKQYDTFMQQYLDDAIKFNKDLASDTYPVAVTQATMADVKPDLREYHRALHSPQQGKTFVQTANDRATAGGALTLDQVTTAPELVTYLNNELLKRTQENTELQTLNSDLPKGVLRMYNKGTAASL